MRAVVLGVLLSSLLFPVTRVRGQEATTADAAQMIGWFLPPPLRDKLDLTSEQTTLLRKAFWEFAGKNREELHRLRREHGKASVALRQALADKDRAAFAKAQRRLGELNRDLQKLRVAFEPRLLAVLTDAQKKKYREFLKNPGRPGGPPPKVDTSKFLPLPELGTGKYQGFTGGLYPDGKNERPAAHEAAGLALAKKVQPLDARGKPDAGGKIVLLSVGMSNAAQEFAMFQHLARTDKDLNRRLVLVNGARGGMTAERIKDANDGADGTHYWKTTDQRLKDAGATPAQVQVIWIKQVDAVPREGFPGYARKLQGELAQIVQLLPRRYPNVRLVYLSSRTYGGWAKNRLNPEPYAYESGFAVKWLIEQQLKGKADLNYDPKRGAVKAPWLSWGPYLWANGTKKRADGFSYAEDDFIEGDRTHPSTSGRVKVAKLMLRFFKTDTTTRPWFVQGTSKR